MALIVLALIVSVLSTKKILKKQLSSNADRYTVVAAEKDTVSTTTYLLSNALPLLAFDFTLWFDVVQFLIILGFLVILCLLHHRCDSNVLLELIGYRLYKCSLRVENKSEVKEKRVTILIRRKQLNVNDEIMIRRLNDELYIAQYKVPEEPPQ